MANLNKIQKAQEKAIEKAFFTAISEVKSQAVLSEIAKQIELKNIDAVIDLLQLSPATYAELETSIQAAYALGGATGATQLGRIPTPTGSLVLRFNTRSVAAEKWLKNLSSTRIVEIADETVKVVRSTLLVGLEQGRNPRSMALDLVGRIDSVTKRRTGGVIGLTEQQASWSVTARQELEALNPNYLTRKLRDRRLDAAFEKAMATGKPMPAHQVDAAIARMESRTLRYRGENIGRTEALSALSEGQNEAFSQAFDLAEIDRQEVTKHWSDSGDSRTRHSHYQVERDYPEGIPFDQPFMVGGERMLWPRQEGASAENTINCRCTLITKIDFAGRAIKELRGFG